MLSETGLPLHIHTVCIYGRIVSDSYGLVHRIRTRRNNHDIIGRRQRLDIVGYTGRLPAGGQVLDDRLPLHSDKQVLVDMREQRRIRTHIQTCIHVHQCIAVRVLVPALYCRMRLPVLRIPVPVCQQVIVVLHRHSSAEIVVADVQRDAVLCLHRHRAVQDHHRIHGVLYRHRGLRLFDPVQRNDRVQHIAGRDAHALLRQHQRILPDRRLRRRRRNPRAASRQVAARDIAPCLRGIRNTGFCRRYVRSRHRQVVARVRKAGLTGQAKVAQRNGRRFRIHRQCRRILRHGAERMHRDFHAAFHRHRAHNRHIRQFYRMSVPDDHALRRQDDRALAVVGTSGRSVKHNRLSVAHTIGRSRLRACATEQVHDPARCQLLRVCLVRRHSGHRKAVR